MVLPHQNWMARGAGGLWGSYTSTGGGGGGTSVVGHSYLDQLRIGQGRIPEAEYPDGYLGTIRSRQDDRLLDSIYNRENQRAYQRGVHKGERIDPADYYWPTQLDPQRGIRRMARGMITDDGILCRRDAPKAEFVPAPHLVNDGKADQTANSPYAVDPVMANQLAHLRPVWS